jgi:hypothetical protein
MEKELANIESEHVLMMERVMQCKRAQVAMAQNVVEAMALLESRRIRDRPMTQTEEQMLATLDKIKACCLCLYVCLHHSCFFSAAEAICDTTLFLAEGASLAGSVQRAASGATIEG